MSFLPGRFQFCNSSKGLIIIWRFEELIFERHFATKVWSSKKSKDVEIAKNESRLKKDELSVTS